MYIEGGVLISPPPQRADSLLCSESCNHCAGSEIHCLWPMKHVLCEQSYASLHCICRTVRLLLNTVGILGCVLTC
jgi:hypothetical protein